MYAVGSFNILDKISIIGAAPLIIPTSTVGLKLFVISTESFSTVSKYSSKLIINFSGIKSGIININI